MERSGGRRGEAEDAAGVLACRGRVAAVGAGPCFCGSVLAKSARVVRFGRKRPSAIGQESQKANLEIVMLEGYLEPVIRMPAAMTAADFDPKRTCTKIGAIESVDRSGVGYTAPLPLRQVM